MAKQKGLSKEEISAMKDYLKEKNAKVEGESALLEAIAKMPEPDRTLAKKVHAIVMKNAPELKSRTWYGMPAYEKEGDVVCFFQNASKFKVRYATLGFSDKANLDEGSMWPVTYALKKLTPTEEAKIASLVKKAVG